MEQKQEDMNNMTNEQLREQVISLQQQLETVTLEKQMYSTQYHSLIRQAAMTGSKQGDEFWQEISRKLRANDTEYIKSLVYNQTISVLDANSQGQTLLMFAADAGNYEIVNLCLNLGADVTRSDVNGHEAQFFAQAGAHVHIEQLLLFTKLNATLGNRIKITAHDIKQQTGIVENILSQFKLLKYDDEPLQFFKDTMVVIMTNIIEQKLSFSDDILKLCWQFESENDKDPLSGDLWASIVQSCKNVIAKGNKKEWHWLKTFILPSTIWFEEVISENKEKSYLYYKLLKLVDSASMEQLKELEQNLNTLSTKDISAWNELIVWNIGSKLQYKPDEMRQDKIPNGIRSKYTFKEIANSSTALFNSLTFYDYNEYLSQLVLTAQIVDNDFQMSIKRMFNVDKHRNVGYLDDAKDGIVYMRGPVKQIERCRTKAQNDYNTQTFPTSACILDLNRCSLVFNSISTMLSALKLLENKIKFFQSGSIIGIIRDKNGFKEYIKQTQYADIKLNVLIKGASNNIIGEIQFLLRTMMNFKNKAHSLYAITRQQEYFENSVSLILPRLLDFDRQLLISASMGNVKELNNLMVICNKSTHEMMKVDAQSNECILNKICCGGHLKALKFIKSVVDDALLVESLFRTNQKHMNVIESILYSNCFDFNMIQYILDMKSVRTRYENDPQLTYKLLVLALEFSSVSIIELIFGKLAIGWETIGEMINSKVDDVEYTDPICKNARLFTQAASNKLAPKVLAKIRNVMGDKLFMDEVFAVDGNNTTCVECMIHAKNIDAVKYALSIAEIKTRYETDEWWMWRLLWWLFAFGTMEMIDYVMNEFKFSAKELIPFLEVKYEEKSQRTFGASGTPYHKLMIVPAISEQHILQYLTTIIGQDTYLELMIKHDFMEQSAAHLGLM
eukprot:148527_1